MSITELAAREKSRALALETDPVEFVAQDQLPPHSATPPGADSPATATLTPIDTTQTFSAPAETVPRLPPWPVRDEIVTLRDVTLDSGVTIPRVNVRFRLEGTLAATLDNLVVVVHALTGTPDVCGWWRGVVGAGLAIDPQRHAVLCANLLGGCAGTSGPRDNDSAPFPEFTTRDQARVLARVIDFIGVQKPLLVCGGSLGGMVTLEFAATFPERVIQAVVLAAPATQTAQGLAWHAIMRQAIAIGGAEQGLTLARMVGMLSYRTPQSLEARFGRAKNAKGEFGVNEWLHAHGKRLVERFHASSYVALIDAMDAHNVGRARGGLAAALTPVGNRLTGVGIPGDILFSADCVREWCEASGATYRELSSSVGHDAFLVETVAVSELLTDALHRATRQLEKQARVAAVSVATGLRRDLDQRHVLPWYRQSDGSASRKRPLRVALAGCGHVGSALLDLFGEQNSHGEKRVEITRILVRDIKRERPALQRAVASGLVARGACVNNASHFLHGDIDVVVEAIGGITTAAVLVEAALKRGVRVVTANKALLATRGATLGTLATLYGTTLDFEAAVAAAVPIVRCLRSGAAGVGITSITGIVNGTTNVVLERVAYGESLHDAVSYAQAEGFAEANATRDLSGEDAEDKLRVLAWLAFGIDPARLRVVRRGINADTARWAAQVAREGDCVKLLASCRYENSTLVARVVPTRVRGTDPWAQVLGPANRVEVESASAGLLVFHGPGAGGRATAGALYGDVFRPVSAAH